jgi:hypothetical protein
MLFKMTFVMTKIILSLPILGQLQLKSKEKSISQVVQMSKWPMKSCKVDMRIVDNTLLVSENNKNR